jgi:hypothetical protein
MIALATEAVLTGQTVAASISPAVEADPVIWTARLRTGRVAILRASVSRALRAAALIALVAAEPSAVIASVAVVDLMAATASVAAEDLVAVALVALAEAAVEDFAEAADSEVDAENYVLNRARFFL